MKKALIVIVALACAASAQAQQATGSASQTQTTSSAATAGTAGNGNGAYVIQNGAPIPADTTTTVRNVSPGVLAAFSSSLNGFDCHYTKAGISGGVPGVGGAVQWNENDTDFCVKGWTQAELNRQSTITEDSKAKAALQQASTNVKCTLDDDIYRSLIAAGVACQTKPEDYDKRNPPIVMNMDGQKVQTALVYLKAQP